MRLTRRRFTVGWLIIDVAILVATSAIEMNVFYWSSDLVSEHGDAEDYILAEAWTVWASIQLPILRARQAACQRGRAAPTPPHLGCPGFKALAAASRTSCCARTALWRTSISARPARAVCIRGLVAATALRSAMSISAEHSAIEKRVALCFFCVDGFTWEFYSTDRHAVMRVFEHVGQVLELPVLRYRGKRRW
jgi:hypothetical protein